jgi:drug/metabolite transporter (DMT)-like permease
VYLISIVIAIGANIIYHLSMSKMPQRLNPFLGLSFSYLVAILLTLFFYLFGPQTGLRFLDLAKGGKNLQMLVAPFAVGLAVVGIEVGFLWAYQSGWTPARAPVYVNTVVAVVLVPVSYFLLKETFSWARLSGVMFCILGIWLLSRK